MPANLDSLIALCRRVKPWPVKRGGQCPDCLDAADGLDALLSSSSAERTEGCRAALREVVTNGAWTEGEGCGEWRVSREVYLTAKDALDQEPTTEGTT